MCEHALRSALLMELASDQRMVRIRAELFCGAGQGARTSESPGAGPPHARNRGRGVSCWMLCGRFTLLTARGRYSCWVYRCAQPPTRLERRVRASRVDAYRS
jgi:hypothetical protein